MKKLSHPIKINEVSVKVQQLHLAMAVLGLQVDEKERTEARAGESTQWLIREYQAKMNIQFDSTVLLDEPTAAAIEKELKDRGLLDDNCTFVVSGRLIGGSGYVSGRLKLMAYDLDLKGIAVYKKIKKIEELNSEGLEFLGETVADREGYYSITFLCDQFKHAERKKADVVVFAVTEKEIAGRSRMVNAEDYSDKGEVRNLDVVVTRQDERTEYERLMATLMPFLEENKVKLEELLNASEQIKFTAGELDVAETNISLAAYAEKMIIDGRRQFSHELLYGLGRQHYWLSLPAFYRKKAGELQAALAKSIKQRIIREFDEQQITAFITSLIQAASEAALHHKKDQDGITLADRLAPALPEAEQQIAFLHSLQSFTGEDYKDFWEKHLPSQAAFKDKPELVKALLATHQLTLITANHLPLVKALQSKLGRNGVADLLELSDQDWMELVGRTGAPAGIPGADDNEKLANYAKHLQDVLQVSYPTELIGLMIKKQQLPLPDGQVAERVSEFLAKTPGFSFTQSRVHDFDKEIGAIGGDKEKTTEALMRIQRVFQVSSSPQAMAALMNNGLDSARSIASIPRNSFIKTYANELGGDLAALSIHERASYINTRAEHMAMKMMEITHSEMRGFVMGAADYQSAKLLMENKVPNYATLFGSPDICECEQCRSVYGAAAYFVDLLRFLWRGVKNDDNKSPLDMLAQRRPDLLHLPLTCENTDTIIPYIDLVNEVMEYYVDKGSLNAFTGYDTGEVTSEELRSDPQHVNLEAYRKLKDAKYPFTLPYHQPLDVIRTYGEHLKTGRHQAMEAVRTDLTAVAGRAIAAESLKISPEEFVILAKEDLAGTADATPLHAYFGYGSAALIESMAGVREFLMRSGVKYTDLVELVKTKFINPHQEVFDFLQDLFKDSALNASQLYTRLQQIEAGALDPGTDAQLMTVLTHAGITANGFTTWVQANFGDFKLVITLYEPDSHCDLDTTFLRTLGNIYTGVNASGITPDVWSRIHRFIRLWRKLGCSIHEADLVLAALDETDIRPETIVELSYLSKLNEALRRPLNQLATLWGSIDTYGDKSLYKKLFLNKTVLNLDTAFAADEWGNYLGDTTEILGDHIPAILAAFRMSQEDFDAVVQTASVIDAVSGAPRLLNLAADVLNIPNLSTIYRYTILSKALKFKVPEFCLLLRLFNQAPFSTWNNQSGKYDAVDPAVTYSFYELAQGIKESGFKPAMLQYIFSGQLPTASASGLDQDKARQIARTIRGSFAAIEQDHPAVPLLPLTTDMLRSKLSLTFQAPVVNQLMAILDGTIFYSVITDANLNISIPAALASKVSYINGSGRLSVTGVLSDNELNTIKGLHASGNYKASADALYAFPEAFLQTNFNGLFAADMPGALATLLDHPAQPTTATLDEKLRVVYDSYLPLLKKKLREDAITQHIASLTGLTEDAARVLLKPDLDNLVTGLAREGYSTTFFNDTTFTTQVLQREDASINFDWQAGSPGPAVNNDNFSVRWNAYLTPPATGEYTLIAEVKEANEAFRIFVDDVLLVEKTNGDALLVWETVVSLNASQMHKLKVEYIETTGMSGIKLSWKTATTAAGLIPSAAVFPAQIIDAFVASAQVYHRAARFISGFELNEAEVDHFVTHQADFAAIDFKALTPGHWKRINDYVSLRDSIPQARGTLIELFRAAGATTPAPVMNTLIELLVNATAWDPIVLAYFVNTHFALAAADLRNEVALLLLKKAVTLVSRTGISADTVAKWGAIETGFDALHATAQLIKSTVKAKYEEADWLTVAGKLSDKIREHQKQALISFLLTKPELQEWGAYDADGLFEYFLIDVQMGSCMDTSRIVQANAAVQMFINRCQLNLESDMSTGDEKGVSATAIDMERWEWMKNYRVWEANRKVFLYPENWLEPDWRDDRSEFFRTLESELVQNDITPQTVDTAYRNYLASLNQVANLEVCGMYQENYSNGDIKFVHVFARTHNAPYQVYYRKWNQYMKWSSWEKVGADVRNIEDADNSGVHMIPVVWKNRLFLFWPEFIERTEETGAASNQNAQEAANQTKFSALEADVFWDIRLAWTEHKEGKWAPKQVSKEVITLYKHPTVRYADYSFSAYIDNSKNELLISAWSTTSYFVSGSFKLTDIQSPVQVTYPMWIPVWVTDPDRYFNNFEKRLKDAPLLLKDDTYLNNKVKHKLLSSNTEGDFEYHVKTPFFYHDAARTYFVRPVPIRIYDQIRFPDQYKPFIPQLVDDSWFTQPHLPEVDPDEYLPDGGWTDPIEIQFGRYGKAELIYNAQAMTIGNTVQANIGVNGAAVNKRMANPAMRSMHIANRQVNEVQLEMSAKSAIAQANVGTVSPAFGGEIGKYKPGLALGREDTGLEFHTFYHPFSSTFVTNLNQQGIGGMLQSNITIASDDGSKFAGAYNPNFNSGFVKKATEPTRTFYKQNVCFDVFGANSMYNWELFYHTPLYIALRLSKNGKFKEARDWFHYIFDPTTDEAPAPGLSETSRYWKVLPFKTTPAEDLENFFLTLSPNSNPSSENMTIGEWRDNPFNPHLVARNRPLAYMKYVVIKYVENLLEWGDSLFRQFTRESVYEALQLYVMANHVLGPRPEFVPRRGDIQAESYFTLKNKLDDFSNAIVQLENLFPYSSETPASAESTGSNLLGIGEALYFCIPSNEKLMESWDRAADRLYKIRHCMDINGVERKLALFAPPIDPAALIQAMSQGLSLGSILADLSCPPPIYRFNYLIQRTNEFCGEVKMLGSALLAALEKKDAEELARLRATHEKDMLDRMTEVKRRQVLEAKSNKEFLLKTRDTAQLRASHYNSLLSTEALVIPAAPTVAAELTDQTALPADTGITPVVTDVDNRLVDLEDTGLKLIQKEKTELDKAQDAKWWLTGAGAADTLAGIFNMIIQGEVKGSPFGVGAGVVWGGINLGTASTAVGNFCRTVGQHMLAESAQAGRIASYIRREEEWALQANLAAREVVQIDKQITSADIRIQMAEKDLYNHTKLIEESIQVQNHLANKFSKMENYQWLRDQLFAVYKQSYNMAYDMSKKTEKTYKYETGNELAGFIQYGYWDNSYQGLTAGEKLQAALRQMEKSYLEENRREFEIRKNVSLAFINPLALQQLRQTGKCFVTLPEEMFDLDFQGQYFRRIKSVALSIPCIAGPLTSISCTLRLLKNHIRTNTSMNDEGNYEHMNDEGLWIEDDRFRSSIVPVEAIAVSNGQNDAGLFELNFRDERYLPFEGAGAISEWKLELTTDEELRQFDYSTISDCIIHLNYTAREDAGLFREKAVTYIKSWLENAAELDTQPLKRMFSMRHEFPNEWYRFLHPQVAGTDQVMHLLLKKEHFPFFTRDRQIDVMKLEIFAKASRSGDYHLLLTATDTDDIEMVSAEISMPESLPYANMQKATVTGAGTGVSVEDIAVFQPMTLKFKHNTELDYHSIGTDPEELEDVFVVIDYKLSDV